MKCFSCLLSVLIDNSSYQVIFFLQFVILYLSPGLWVLCFPSRGVLDYLIFSHGTVHLFILYFVNTSIWFCWWETRSYAQYSRHKQMDLCWAKIMVFVSLLFFFFIIPVVLFVCFVNAERKRIVECCSVEQTLNIVFMTLTIQITGYLFWVLTSTADR